MQKNSTIYVIVIDNEVNENIKFKPINIGYIDFNIIEIKEKIDEKKKHIDIVFFLPILNVSII
jgi:hypothetical protein